MELHIAQDLDQLSRDLADWITEHIQSTLERQDRYTWSLSGGSTPRRLYELLTRPGYKEKIPWEKLHLFWGDERAVPFDDERNNGRMTYEALLRHVPVPEDQIHYMRTDIGPEASAAAYEKLLHQYFGATGTSFDLVLLGMGDDGHTLSLFPGLPVVHEQEAWVTSFYLPTQQMHRITLTAPIVNRSAQVVFLAAGAGKADTLKEVLEGPFRPEQFPSQVIRPSAGTLHWFVDKAAAARLNSHT
ncbi:6-phosphogluconolactonase [Compostibacter hankyongensis]|uniref:6-phosphogluconolactonase n=1 Tax=Compostibacter hankyongensis TaxID=1007089 RepID=A0ABP8G278_9BACT